MSPTAKEVFLDALAHVPGERTSILAQACAGDPTLRAEVEELLRVHDQAGQFMSRPVDENGTQGLSRSRLRSPPSAASLSEKPGTTIGRYKLLQQIGEGGFGAVYMAEQEHPVRRKVALKIIKLGMDTRQVIARFEAERQALAMMDHPHIAKVLDAGATDTGRPYFVMELVKGVPITGYCDEERVPLAGRLDLFLNVCSAVQHAHQKGIIHRDIKPSNILVTLHDGKPVPKVIDFGIAKATEHRLTERTLFTEYGQFIGTPAYMSPEQAEMSGLDVDTRSDIYSLGVLLYELLTSSLPFDPRRLRSAGQAEMARIIKEEEPHRPSARLRTMASAAEARASATILADSSPVSDTSNENDDCPKRTSSLLAIARMRHTDPQSLVRTLRGDLDWIVMKCLEKDRTRRYDTANSLARDIANFLGGETVSAAPPSTAYRVRKFVRRNRAIVTTIAVVVAALVIGLAAATAGFVQARQQRNKAQSAYAGEQEQRRIAVVERDKARDYAEELRHELYASKIEKIQRILATDGLEPVKPLLAECDEELRGWEWDRLNYLADRSAGTLQAATTQIYDLHGSRDGTFLIASADLVPSLWDSETLELRAEFKDPEAPGQSRGVLSEDGKVVATSDGSKVHMWDSRSGRLLRSFSLDRTSLHQMALDASASQLAVGYWDGGFTIHDISTGALLLEGGEKPSSGRTVAFSSDGKHILSASMNNDVSVSGALDGRQLWAKRGAGFVLLNAVFSPDERLVATVGQDSRLWVRKADTGELVYTVATGKGGSQAVAFHPDGTIIAVGGIDGLISFFRTSNGEKLYSLHGSEVEITAIAFDPSGRFLVSAASDGSVKKWHLGAGGPQVRVGHTHAINSLAFSSDDQHLWVVGGTSRDLQLLNVPGLKKLPVDPPMDNPRGVVLSPDGKRLAIVGSSADGSVCLLLNNKLDVLHRWKLPSDQWPIPVFSDDSRWLVVTQITGEVCLFDALTGQAVWQAGDSREDAPSRNAALFSPDGRYVLNGSRTGTIRVYDVSTGGLSREFRVEDLPVGPLVLDSSGKRLFVGGSGIGRIDVWDWLSEELLMTMSGHTGGIGALAMLPGDHRLVSGGSDATVRLWDVSSGRQVMVVGRHDGPVGTIAVSHDGATIATGGYDNSLRLWETREPSLEGLDARYERARPTWVGYRNDD